MHFTGLTQKCSESETITPHHTKRLLAWLDRYLLTDKKKDN